VTEVVGNSADEPERERSGTEPREPTETTATETTANANANATTANATTGTTGTTATEETPERTVAGESDEASSPDGASRPAEEDRPGEPAERAESADRGERAELGRLSAPRAVALVAGREIVARGRTKAFAVTTGIMVAALVAVVVILHFVGGPSTSSSTVGVTPSAAALSRPLAAVGESLGITIRTPPVADLASGERALRSGDLDALLLGVDPDGRRLDVAVRREIDDDLRAALTLTARQTALDTEITRLGADPVTVNTAVAGAGVSVTSLEPPRADRTPRLVLGVVSGILVYLALVIYGQVVATSVVEEKATRIVELLLSVIRPWQLMAGKVLGVGAIAIGQLAVVGAVGLATALGTGELNLPASLALGSVGWALLWFVLGFFTFALLYAAAGALVSRQEDIGSASAPLTMIIIVPYVIGISVLPANPDSGLVKALSMVPLCSVTLMPMRAALGVPGWQLAIALTGTVVTLALLVVATGRVYGNAVLRTGTRIRLGDALRAT
jgi:ABC-2 type transport system permease protein